jgi:hypothetical protein
VKIGIRILQFRKGIGYADAFFTTQIGVEDDAGGYTAILDVRDCELRTAQSGERYVKYPAKPRIKKVDDQTAAYQRDATGKVIYDQLVESPREKKQGTEEWYMTPAGKSFKDRILQAVLQMAQGQSAEAAGRGSGARAAQPRTPVAAAVATGEPGNPLAASDDLPF